MLRLLVILAAASAASSHLELKVGQILRFKSVNFPNHYISRLSNGRVAISSSASDKDWIVRAGLAGKGFSLESQSGGFLRHRNYQVWVDPESSADLYKKDSSFTIEQGAAGKGISFKSVNFPSHSLRHAGYNLWIHAHDGSQLFSLDSSFEVIEVFTPQNQELKVGQRLRFRSVNFPNHYISRLSNGRVAISSSAPDKDWIVRAGLAGKGFSLESQSGGFLRHRNYQVWVDPESSADLYKKDSSFTIEQGAAGKGISFKSVNFPSHSLRHAGYNLWIHAHDGSQLFSLDSSFEVIEVFTPQNQELKVGQRLRFRSVNFPNHYISRLSNGRVAISSSAPDKDWIVRAGLAGKGFSLESQSGGFLRHRNYQVWVDPESSADLYKKDSSFTIEQGAAGKGISFKSVNFPSYSLRHAGYNLWINAHDGSHLFSLDSSFEVIQVV